VKKPVGVLRFLGTNCDIDVWRAVEFLGAEPKWLWHADNFDPADYSSFIVPGGFSYGDYLRCGALAAKAPAMQSLADAARQGRPVLGICNGFQILCEARLLPGALVRNEKRRFVDKWVNLRLVNKAKWNAGSKTELRLPVAHGEGRFYMEKNELEELHAREQVWFTYVGGAPNGSLDDIAGVTNLGKNVCALMPHPERAMINWMGSDDGREIINSILG
jgi:phosphoribosylformylglycinamidine synthase I